MKENSVFAQFFVYELKGILQLFLRQAVKSGFLEDAIDLEIGPFF